MVARVERQNGPIHLAVRELGTQITRNPEQRTVELHASDASLFDAESIVELAVVVGSAVAGMARVFARRGGLSGRLGIEVALAEHRTAARLDDGRLERPILGGVRGERERRHQKHARTDEQSNLAHLLPPKAFVSLKRCVWAPAG